jgi:hypothetical protein
MTIEDYRIKRYKKNIYYGLMEEIETPFKSKLGDIEINQDINNVDITYNLKDAFLLYCFIDK